MIEQAVEELTPIVGTRPAWPHVHRDGLDLGELFLGEALVVDPQGLLATTVGNMLDDAPFEVGDHCHVLVALLERGLVDADPTRHFKLAPREAPLDGTLHHSIDLVPAQIQLPRHRRGARLTQPIDHQGLEQRRESRPRLCPRHLNRLDPVLRTSNPRNLGCQDCPVLAGRKMTPTPKPRVVARHRGSAHRALQRRRSLVLHAHLHLALRRPKLHARHPPRLLYPENLCVQVGVPHPRRLRHPPGFLKSLPI